MTHEELENLYLETEHGTFTPNYTYDDFTYNEETQENEYIGLVIHKTAQEVYDEWLVNKDKPVEPQPNEIQLCLERIELQEESTLDIDYRVTCIELGI